MKTSLARRCRVVVLLNVLGVLSASDRLAHAQTVSGRVVSNETGRPVSGVEVQSGAVRTFTDTTGDFVLRGLAGGTATIAIRRLGYASRDTVLQGRPGDSVFVVIRISPLPQPLDTVHVAAPGTSTWLLPEFEARRRRGEGRFLSREQLRLQDDRAFVDVLRASMPTLGFIEASGETYLYSRVSARACYVQIVWDGMPIFRHESGSRKMPPDIASLFTRDFDGVEYYSSPVTTPVQYRSTGSECGTLILWSRRR